MKNKRLIPFAENQLFKTTLNHYTHHHLTPKIKTSAYLKTYSVDNTTEPFKTLLFSSFQNLLKNYPERSYQQLQQKIEARQLAPAEHQHLENGIEAINQKLVANNTTLNQDKKIWYRIGHPS